MNDKKLIELLHKDREAGMTALIKQYSGFVFSVVRAVLSGVCDSSETEDCVTDVFISFYSGLGDYKADASVKTYLGRIARNASLNCLRNRAPLYSVEDDLTLEIPDGGDLCDEAAEKDLLRRIFAEIRSFGPPDSDILFRKYYLGQSSKQIANELGLTVSAIDTRAHRAVQKLKEKFKGEIL